MIKTLTVLIPVFNTEPAALMEAIKTTLVALDKCGLESYDVILVDDGSTRPDTISTLDLIADHPYVRLKRLEKNVGTPVAYNIGHEMVNTAWVALMGSDDVCDPNRFAIQLAHLNKAEIKGEHIDVLGTQLFSFYDDDISRVRLMTSQQPYDSSLSAYHVKNNWYTNHGTVIYRDAAVKSVGGYNPALRRAQDVDLWKRMVTAGKVIRTLPNVLYAWRRYRNK